MQLIDSGEQPVEVNPDTIRKVGETQAEYEAREEARLKAADPSIKKVVFINIANTAFSEVER